MLVDIWTVLPAVVVAAAIAVVVGWRSRMPIERIAVLLAIFAYGSLALSLTMLPLRFDREFIDAMRAGDASRGYVNLIPLFAANGTHEVARQLLANLVLGVPFGVLVPLYQPRWSLTRIASLGIASAFAIELAQLVIDVAYGFGYRTVDVNDVIANGCGVGVGLIAFILLRTAFRRLGLQPSDVGAYLADAFDPTRRGAL